MKELLRKLSGGDLRSDGRANEVAEKVTQNSQSLSKLAEALSGPDDVIRARTAHALEKISSQSGNRRDLYPNSSI